MIWKCYDQANIQNCQLELEHLTIQNAQSLQADVVKVVVVDTQVEVEVKP